MKIIETPLKGAYVIKPEPFQDNRGMFCRIFCKKELEIIGFDKEIVQVNHSTNRKQGALRGMHFQKPPKSEIKFVKCLRGAVWDVIVDLRESSPTFLKWHGERLTHENMHMMYIPKGFAHGFQTLQPDTELLYFHTEFYSPDNEDAVRFDDPKINIRWPLEITEISDRDKNHAFITDIFDGF